MSPTNRLFVPQLIQQRNHQSSTSPVVLYEGDSCYDRIMVEALATFLKSNFRRGIRFSCMRSGYRLPIRVCRLVAIGSSATNLSAIGIKMTKTSIQENLKGSSAKWRQICWCHKVYQSCIDQPLQSKLIETFIAVDHYDFLILPTQK